MSKTCSDICSKYGQDKLRYAKDMARICPRCAQDMPTTLLIYAHDMLKIQSPRLNHFQGWPVRDSVFFWILAQFGGGKKDGSPCVSQICPTYVLYMSTICLHPRERWDDFDCSRDQSNISLSPMLQPNYQTTNQPRKYRAPSRFSYLLINWEILSIWSLARGSYSSAQLNK